MSPGWQFGPFENPGGEGFIELIVPAQEDDLVIGYLWPKRKAVLMDGWMDIQEFSPVWASHLEVDLRDLFSSHLYPLSFFSSQSTLLTTIP